MALNAELLPLYEEVACLLSGRSVIVQLRQPADKGAYGSFMRSGSQGIIQVNPDLPPFIGVRIYCHEVAHARLHFDAILSSSHHAKAPQSVLATPAVPAHEDSADKLGDIWFDYGLAHMSTSPWVNWEQSILLALKNYYV